MDNFEKLQFCKFRSGEFEKIDQQLSSVFQIPQAEVEALYRKIGSDFNQDYWPPTNYVSREIFRSQDSQFRDEYERSPSVGIDLPSILEIDDGNENKPTVVLLGQDPKRGYSHPEISIGTPYGLHLKKSRKEHSTIKFYCQMIQVLMRMGYRVYLTDIFKIWVCNPEHCYKGTKLPKLDKQRFLKTLELEIAAVQPTAVITWGSPAKKSAQKMNIDRHLSFPHPSGAANGVWKKLMGVSPTYSNKLAYWDLNVKHYLKSQSALA